jgi:glutathione S-transferase
MIVYGSSLSPFVRKLLVVADEKGLVMEVEPTAPNSNDPAFREASPFGKIPGFRDGDFAISDSTAIISYLEALRPEPAMAPREPKLRARTVWFDEFADTILTPVLAKMFFNRIVSPKFMGRPGDLAAADKAEHEEAPPLMAYLEGVMAPSGFLVDERLTLADIAVASPFVNAMHAGYEIDADAYPKTAAYVATLHARPSFAAHIAAEKAILGG